jgi:hypothetical protein
MLYVQAEQIDGADRRNILIARVPANVDRRRLQTSSNVFGEAFFNAKDVTDMLDALGFPKNASLSVLAVELLPQKRIPEDPMSADLGGQRILRTSPLTVVPTIC